MMTFKSLRCLFLCLLISQKLIYSDIRGVNGIRFDNNADLQPEMVLNTVGLGIGADPSANLHVNGNVLIETSLNIGGESGDGNLNLHGTMRFNSINISANAMLSDYSLNFVDSSNDNIILTLPYAGNANGLLYKVKKISSLNKVWLTTSSNLIDETTSVELVDLAAVDLISNGQNWYVFNQHSVNASIAADNLLGWWKLDEVQGTTATDSSDQDNDLALSSLDFGVDGTLGRVINGITLSSSSDYLSAGDLDSFDQAEEFSIAAWVKISSTTSDDVIVHKGASWGGAAPQVIFWRDDMGAVSGRDDTFAIYVSDSNSNTRVEGVSNIGLNVGEWIHVVGTCRFNDSKGLRLYVNGVEDVNSPASTIGETDLANASELRIGNDISGTRDFDGSLDDVRIYSRVLTASEVEALYQQGQ